MAEENGDDAMDMDGQLEGPLQSGTDPAELKRGIAQLHAIQEKFKKARHDEDKGEEGDKRGRSRSPYARKIQEAMDLIEHAQVFAENID